MMRILFVRSNPVDPDARVEKEVNSLVKSGYHVEVVGWDRKNKYKLEKSCMSLNSGTVNVYRFGIPSSFSGGLKRNLLPLIKFQIRLFTWLLKNKRNYDIVHACDFDTAWISSLFVKIFNKTLVYDIFDYYVDAFSVPKLLKGMVECADKRVINSAEAVIICSEKRTEQIRGTNPRLLTIIHNSPARVDNTRLGNIKLDKHKVKIVYAGILSDGRFIKEVASIVVRYHDVEFHIGGFGKYEEYFKEISQEYDNIFFYGKLKYSDVLQLENACDIMIALYDPKVPNHYYAAPNKFYEAMMLGKPIIMVKNTGMDEIVSKHNIGEVIEYNPDSFEKALATVINRKAEWPAICSRMKQLYHKDYSWSIMERRLLELYESL